MVINKFISKNNEKKNKSKKTRNYSEFQKKTFGILVTMLIVVNDTIKYFAKCPVCNKYYPPFPSFPNDLKMQKTKEKLVAIENELKSFNLNIKVGIPCCKCYEKLKGLWS